MEDKFEESVYLDMHSAKSLRELARQAGMSVSKYKAEFRRHFGYPPQRWFAERRLERALFMLTVEGWPMKEVAEECHFTSQAHLTCRVRARFGCTPSAFREIYRKELGERFWSDRERVAAYKRAVEGVCREQEDSQRRRALLDYAGDLCPADRLRKRCVAGEFMAFFR